MLVGEFAIPDTRLGAFRSRVAELSARSVRLGGAPFRVETAATGPKDYRVIRRVFAEGAWQAVEATRSLPTTTLRVEGEIPRIPGHALVGFANLKNNLGPDRMVVVPGPGRSRPDVADAVMACTDARGSVTCAHCRTARNRKLAFVLESEADGSVAVYGSDCVTDFTGVDVAAVARAYEGLLADAGELEERRLESYTLVEWDWEGYRRAVAADRELRLVGFDRFVLAAADAILSDGGYLGPAAARKAGVPPVSDRAVAMARGSGPVGLGHPDWLAPAFREWIASMGYRKDDLWKLRRHLSDVDRDGGRMDPDLADDFLRGMVAWSAERSVALAGTHFSEPGERLDLEVTVLATDRWDEDVALAARVVTQRVTHAWLSGPGGERFLWARKFRLSRDDAGDPFPLEGCRGERWELRGTVKAHDVDSRCRAVTVLERVKLGARLAPRPEPGAAAALPAP